MQYSLDLDWPSRLWYIGLNLIWLFELNLTARTFKGDLALSIFGDCHLC